MKYFNKKTLNVCFYLAIIYVFIIFVIPSKYIWGVYSPNLLGWTMIVTFILGLFLFFLLLIKDIYNKNVQSIKKRTLFILVIITISIVYWYIEAKSMGNV